MRWLCGDCAIESVKQVLSRDRGCIIVMVLWRAVLGLGHLLLVGGLMMTAMVVAVARCRLRRRRVQTVLGIKQLLLFFDLLLGDIVVV